MSVFQEQHTDQVSPQLSYSHFDSQLEERLNDIEELIQSTLGPECLTAGEPPSTTHANDYFLPALEFLRVSPCAGDVDANSNTEPSNNAPEVEIEVQIMDLKDVYYKTTKKTLDGLEYPLEDSEVTVVSQPSEEITCVRAYTQRCPEAAIRTHDTIGPVELNVNTLQKDPKSRVVSVNLGSVYKTRGGHPVYWLEKADIVQRNKWQLIIAMEFSSGLTGSVTSKPFRVTTKAAHKMRRKGDDAYISRQELKEFKENSSCHHVLANNSESILDSKSFSLAKGRILFQPNTVLDRHAVTEYYIDEQRIYRAVEQPELPGLLKLVGKQSKAAGPRRKANGCKSFKADFWWACGVCFFERRKKTTIKDHVIRRVCQKSITKNKTKFKGKVKVL